MAEKAGVFNRPRWLVVAGAGKLEQYAAAEAGAILQQHLPYVLQTFVGGCDRRRVRRHNLLLVGTARSNPLIGALAADGRLKAPRGEQAYAIAVIDGAFGPDRQALVLCGADERGALYAARDWEHYCYDPYAASLIPHARPQPNVARAKPAAVPFHKPLPAWDLRAAPKVPWRGIWTWGHVIYDYRRFLENRMRQILPFPEIPLRLIFRARRPGKNYEGKYAR